MEVASIEVGVLNNRKFDGWTLGISDVHMFEERVSNTSTLRVKEPRFPIVHL